MTMAWPEALRPQRCSANLRSLVATGGRSATGREQRVIGYAGHWEITLGGIVIRTAAQANIYRAMLARLRQGEDIMVPVFDVYRPVGNRAPAASAALSGAVALRATTATIAMTAASLAAGNYISIGDRLHLVTEITSSPGAPPLVNQVAVDAPWSDAVPFVDATAATGNYGVRIMPPLRSAAPSGTPVEIKNPKLRCVPKDLGDGDLDLELLRRASPSLTFIEFIGA